MKVLCSECKSQIKSGVAYTCPKCDSTVLVHYDKPDVNNWIDESESGIWKYHRLLPPVATEQRMSLGEGNTPLIRSISLGKQLGIEQLYFKWEGSNPTGSYKDRIAALGVAWALTQGRSACAGTTSGNSGAAIAAYAARAQIPYHLLVLEQMASQKLAQVIAYGANVQRIKKFGGDPKVGQHVFETLFEVGEALNWETLITAFRYNPYAMEGVKTISFEIANQLSQPPTHVFVPMGGAGLYVGMWKGFMELAQFKHQLKRPQLIGIQPEGCANIVRAFQAGEKTPLSGASTTHISGLQVPNPPDGGLALEAMNAGGGFAAAVSDERIWQAQQRLAKEEGILCEPAAAASVAGLIKQSETTIWNPSDQVVCILTGNGLKDEASLSRIAPSGSVPLRRAEELHNQWLRERRRSK